jgi:hypothetical protein
LSGNSVRVGIANWGLQGRKHEANLLPAVLFGMVLHLQAERIVTATRVHHGPRPDHKVATRKIHIPSWQIVFIEKGS